MKKWIFLLIMMVLWHPPLTADTTTSSQGTPRITLTEPGFQFEPVIEGDVVVHEFTIQNSGNAPLEILKIQTG